MAYHFIHELTHTIRQRPVRTALAAVLLITTTIYVCAGHQQYRVAEIGDRPSAAETQGVIDLSENPSWTAEIEQVVADEDDAPAMTTRVDGRERYSDARLTHAVAEEDDVEAARRTHVDLVSGESERHASDQAPVWLLGVLQDD